MSLHAMLQVSKETIQTELQPLLGTRTCGDILHSQSGTVVVPKNQELTASFLSAMAENFSFLQIEPLDEPIRKVVGEIWFRSR